MAKLDKSGFIAMPSQKERLVERHTAEPVETTCCGMAIRVFGGVYQTSADTELMAEAVQINPTQTFLEIGCGTGVVSIVLGKKALSGVGVDINGLAIENSKFNARRHNITNVSFFRSDVFNDVKGKFDVIVCNPPYSDHPAADNIEKMFWDSGNEVKRRFFKEAKNFLNADGRIYFGWANFADLDLELPFRLAREAGFEIEDIYNKLSPKKICTFYVLKFKNTDI